MPKCEYCGNTSGKRDNRGGCISCGASLSISTTSPTIEGSQYFGLYGAGVLSEEEARALTMKQPMSVSEIVRRSVGLL